jgi:hypothetical protein
LTAEERIVELESQLEQQIHNDNNAAQQLVSAEQRLADTQMHLSAVEAERDQLRAELRSPPHRHAHKSSSSSSTTTTTTTVNNNNNNSNNHYNATTSQRRPATSNASRWRQPHTPPIATTTTKRPITTFGRRLADETIDNNNKDDNDNNNNVVVDEIDELVRATIEQQAANGLASLLPANFRRLAPGAYQVCFFTHGSTTNIINSLLLRTTTNTIVWHEKSVSTTT